MSRSLALSPALPRAANGVAQPLDLGVAEIDIGHAKERCDRLLGVVTEIGTDDVRENVFTRRLGRLGRIVYVARTVLSMLDQLLFAEDAEYGAHGGVGWRIGKVSHDLRHGSA